MRSTIYKDEAAIERMQKAANALAVDAKRISDIWNKQHIMGAMSQKEFKLMLSGGVPYFMEAFRESIRRDEARIKGEAYYNLADVSKYSPAPFDGDVNFDAARLERTLNTMRARRMNALHGVDWDLVDFDKKGSPFIPKAVNDWIDDQHTIYATDDNMKAFEDGQKDASIINELIAKGYEIKAGAPFVRDGNGYAYGVKNLTFGSGKKPPKAVDAVYSPPVVDDVLSQYQPVNLSKGAVKSKV